ncbi:MAG: molybdopterin synthase catalytic subunit MoaE [Pseudomonadota bacterium]
MDVRVQEADFDVSEELRAVQTGNRGIGAVVNFVGLVRDHNDNRGVGTMTLEHYPGMTERAIESIVREAAERWHVQGATVIHRVGELSPGEQIVLVVIASGHRGDAFLACEFVMDFLKMRAPFWKKEVTTEGEHWVAFRASDESAAKRWEKPVDA